MPIGSDDRLIPGPSYPILNSSGNLANASAVATLAAVADKVAHLSGFHLTASGATAGLAVGPTITGLIVGTVTYAFTFPAGVLVAATPLTIFFPFAIPASAANTAIVVTLPAGGAGNTRATCNAYGYYLNA